MRRNIHRQVYLWSCAGIAFAIPVWGRLLPTLIVILILNWLVSGDFIRNFPRLKSERERRNMLAFSGLYLLYVAGLLWTTDFDYAWFDLEVKLSMLIFPLVFATADFGFLYPGSFRLILRSYVAGCVAGSLILFSHSVMLWKEGVENAFFYLQLGWHFHASYYAMYLNLAIAVILTGAVSGNSASSKDFRPGNDGSRFPGPGWVLVSCWFFVFIFLLSSKMGLISLVLNGLFTATYWIIIRKRYMSGIILLTAFSLSFWACTRVFSLATSRFDQSAETIKGNAPRNQARSTADRIDIWKASIDIIRSSPLTGVGTGDVKDKLMEKYRERNISHALEFKLNAHNQYLQTFMTLGVPGISLLLLMLILPALTSFRKKCFLYLFFILLFAVNILVESMLETQAGVVWYAFFNSVFFLSGRET
jgi:O-antigen ligase